MTWSLGGKGRDVAIESELAARISQGMQGRSPEEVRALRAVQEFVRGAHLNIPLGSTIAFTTTGHLDGRGRGEVNVRVLITDTPADR